jgi:hypothetical protein
MPGNVTRAGSDRLLLIVVALAAVLSVDPLDAHARSGHNSPPRRALQATDMVRALAFEPNQGQFDPAVRYLARGSNYDFFLTRDDVVIAPRCAEDNCTQKFMRIRLATSQLDPVFSVASPLRGRLNYLIGNDQKKWRRDVPTYGRVIERAAWPGIDVAWYGAHNQLESDFIVAPMADPSEISLAIENADRLSVDSHGDVIVCEDDLTLKLLKPTAYQIVGGQRRERRGRYLISSRTGQQARLKFAVGTYDRRLPLVIDPVIALDYSTYFGGTNGGSAVAIAVDASGSAYIAGSTTSSDLPISANPIQKFQKGRNAFVTKFSPDGKSIVYSTYLGGSGIFAGGGGRKPHRIGEHASPIAVSSDGRACVTGSTFSTDFPVQNAFQTSNNGATNAAANAFLSVLSPDGSSLLYSTYLGGSGINNGAPAIAGSGDGASGIALDGAGAMYVTGGAFSVDFPITSGALQITNHASGIGAGDAFVSKFSADGSALIYSTYLGGSGRPGSVRNLGSDSGTAIAVDSTGSAYITGVASSADFPVTAEAFQTTNNNSASSGYNAFVTRLSADGASLIYSSYLGGSGIDAKFGDRANAISIDVGGNAYVAGDANSTDFPTTPGAFQTVNHAAANVGDNAFLSTVSPDGTALVYSTYLGGSGDASGNGGDFAAAIAVDSTGSAYLTGTTLSKDFPLLSPLQAVNKVTESGGTAFVTQVAPSGKALVFSTYLGGSGDGNGGGDAGSGIAIDGSGSTYVAGDTWSSDFPTKNAFQKTNQSAANLLDTAFVTKFAPPPVVAPTLSATKLAFGSVVLGSSSPPMSVTVTNPNSALVSTSILLSSISSKRGFTISNNSCGASVAPFATCDIDVTFTPPVPLRPKVKKATGLLTIKSSASHKTQKITLSGTGTPT